MGIDDAGGAIGMPLGAMDGREVAMIPEHGAVSEDPVYMERAKVDMKDVVS